MYEAYLYLHLRDAHRAEGAANQTLVLAEEGGFPYLSGLARVLLGWARTQLGDAAEGVTFIREGLTGLTQIGSRVGITLISTLLAEAQALTGKVDDALGSIKAALSANPEELLFWPHALTARGELHLKAGKPELAEADFRQAIAVAQKTRAKSYELRATTSLARLLRDTGRHDEAREMLAEIYNWFTEGFDTADFEDAKVLLDELEA